MALVAVGNTNWYWPRKRDLLLFDRIDLLGGRVQITSSRDDKLGQWLVEHGVVSHFGINLQASASTLSAGDTHQYWVDTNSYGPALHALRAVTKFGSTMLPTLTRDHMRKVIEPFAEEFVIDPDEIVDRAGVLLANELSLKTGIPSTITRLEVRFDNNIARGASLCHLSSQEDEIVPILLPEPTFNATNNKLVPKVEIVLNHLPEPAAEARWQDILEFRQDKAAIRSLRRLRIWMRSISTRSQSLSESKDELEALIDEYSAYMKAHRLTTRQGRLQVICTLVAEIVDSRTRLKLSPAVRALFDVKRVERDLYEAEQRAPGRDIAYIVEASRHFASTSANSK